MTDPLGKGFHTLQAMIAIGSAACSARADAGHADHLEFIPERTTDFIFAVYSEEFAWSAISFCWRCFLHLSCRACRLRKPRRHCSAIAAAVDRVDHLHLCICQHGMVSGVLPFRGRAFAVHQLMVGTALVTLGLACGILMSILRQRRLGRRDRVRTAIGGGALDAGEARCRRRSRSARRRSGVAALALIAATSRCARRLRPVDLVQARPARGTDRSGGHQYARRDAAQRAAASDRELRPTRRRAVGFRR